MVFYCGYKRSAGKFSKCYGGYYREYSVNAKVARAIKTVFYALDLPNLAEVLDAFRQQYPGIPLELIPLPNDEVPAQLQAYKTPPALVGAGTSIGGVVHFPGISADQSLTRWPFHPIRWT